MTPDKNLPDLAGREAIAPRRFDPRTATPFVNKSVSEETRRAYRRAVSDFFQFAGSKHPAEDGHHQGARSELSYRQVQSIVPSTVQTASGP